MLYWFMTAHSNPPLTGTVYMETKMRTITRTRWLQMALFVVCAALPALADWGAAESPSFTVNTIPEPAAALVLAAVLALSLRLRARTQVA